MPTGTCTKCFTPFDDRTMYGEGGKPQKPERTNGRNCYANIALGRAIKMNLFVPESPPPLRPPV